MREHTILLPTAPRVAKEEGNKGTYEIDNLYPGYGHTLGNSLRRIILSSLPGIAITSIKIGGVSHEFSTIEGVREDVVTIMLHLKKVRFKLTGADSHTFSFTVKGPGKIFSQDIEADGQVEVLTKDEYLFEITGKTSVTVEVTLERGMGFVPKEMHQKDKVDIGTIAVDAVFTPIRRVAYEVENMRVGDKTNHNRLRMIVETDGTISPREALDNSIMIMLEQLKAMVGVKDEVKEVAQKSDSSDKEDVEEVKEEEMTDLMKTRIDSLGLSTRTLNALNNANIRTLGGLARKKEEDLLEIEGIGDKGITEIRKELSAYGIVLKA
jgi:DNA-directed RNA polymerase subunit alpha